MKKGRMLSVKEAAKITGAGVSTINLWCRQGKLNGATQKETPFGKYWEIPESSLSNITVKGPGRPRKSTQQKTTAKKKRA